MDYEVNPFQVLYVTDSPDPRVFVSLFSDFPIKHAQALFQQGNVVVRGMQGAGKSMLLNLLRPQIRLAYYQAEATFPVPRELSKFVGAGINLTRSGILDIGQRPLGVGDESELSLFPLYFADFLNYFVVQDLLSTLELMTANPDAFDSLVTESRLDDFAARLAADDCWFGALLGCDSFRALKSSIAERLSAYRAFHQYNVSHLSQEIEESKTAVGEPISRAEEHLKSSSVIDDGTALFIRIDQIERLFSSDVLRPELGRRYRRILNKAISLRDSRVSYCIGVRTYAWNDDLTIYETEDQLEHIRDFRFIDLDEILRRRENTRDWVFPAFAEDVFMRRLKHAAFSDIPKKKAVKKVFGPSISPQQISELAKDYCAQRTADDMLGLHNGWPTNWRNFLRDLFAKDPLEAKLATAWAQQRGQSGKRGTRLKQPPPSPSQPWLSAYWKKDRDRMALRQIEARLAQRSQWFGEPSILALSAGNISVFLSICHEIWDVHLRAERRKRSQDRTNALVDGIHPNVQAVGIQTASAFWQDKIAEQPKGHDRKQFVDVLGRVFRKWLLDDQTLSYPGHNGFSLTNEELKAHPHIARFLRDAADFGDLCDTGHMTKERDRKPRTKWYLMPILSDYYQIREAHTREPYYASVGNIIAWLKEAEIYLEGVDYSDADPKLSRRPVQSQSLPLFSDE